VTNDQRSPLTTLQRTILEAFFRHEGRFFLTGGAALAGFVLRHRETHDLDLFTSEEALDDGDRALQAAARDVGATAERLQTSPDFRRWLLRRADEGLVVDLVRDRTPQWDAHKTLYDRIRVDSPDEILANKLCALLSRAEIRDLVDVRALEQAGFSLEQALRVAATKDAGLSPAQLAWVLSSVQIGDDALIPGGVEAGTLREYLANLQSRLALLAFPEPRD
jgi:hypothetical protein